MLVLQNSPENNVSTISLRLEKWIAFCMETEKTGRFVHRILMTALRIEDQGSIAGRDGDKLIVSPPLPKRI